MFHFLRPLLLLACWQVLLYPPAFSGTKIYGNSGSFFSDLFRSFKCRLNANRASSPNSFLFFRFFSANCDTRSAVFIILLMYYCACFINLFCGFSSFSFGITNLHLLEIVSPNSFAFSLQAFISLFCILER